MNDPTIFQHINDLAAEEEKLYAKAGDGGGLDSAELVRLDTIKVELDQCYDLLHQREARRSTRLDPDAASMRSPDVVERYQQ